MQQVSQKWKNAQKELLLPEQNIEISYYDTDPDVEGYTDTTYETSALGNISVNPEGGYNIYFDGGINLFEKEIALEFYNADGFYSVGGAIQLYDENDNNIFSADILTGNNTFSYLFEFNETVYRIQIFANNFEDFLLLTAVNIQKKYILDKENIMSASFSQSGDLLSFSLPENAFTFTLDNSDETYNPENPDNKLSKFDNKQLIDVNITQNYADGSSETIAGGEYFIDSWDIPQNGINADFSARDGITFMNHPAKFTQQTSLIDGKYKPFSELVLNGSYGIKTNYRLYNGNSEYDNFVIELSFYYNGTTHNTEQFVYGAFDSITNYLSFYVNTSGYFVFEFSGVRLTTNIQAETGKLYNVYVGGFYYNSEFFKYAYLFAGINGRSWEGRFDGATPLTLPYYALEIGALNDRGTVKYPAPIRLVDDVVISKRKQGGNEYTEVARFTPVQDAETQYFGLYDLVGEKFSTTSNGSGVTGDGTENYDSLYYRAYFLFVNSGVPNTPRGQIRFSDISNTLKGIPTTGVDFSDIDNSYAEAIQLCANAGKCVWYWDRNCMSHIVPFDIPDKLPDKYTPLEYVKLPNNNTTLFVNTGISTTNKAVYLNFSVPNVGNQVLLGSTRSGSQNYILTLGNSKYVIYYNGSYNSYGSPVANREIKFIFNGLQNYKMSANGSVFSVGAEAQTPSDPAGDILVGAWLNGGSHTMTSNFNGNIYSFVIANREAGTVEADYRPCVDKETGIFLLYDMKTGQEITPVRYEWDGTASNYIPSGAFESEYTYCGAVTDFKDLPTTGISENDLYVVTSANATVFWNTQKWICLDYNVKNMGYIGYGTSVSDLPAEGGISHLENDIFVLYLIENDTTVTEYYYYDGENWNKFDFGAPIEDYVIDTFNSFQNSDITMTEQLSAVQVNNELFTYNIQNEGVVQEISNPLIVDKDHAFEVARWVARILKHRRNLSGEFRPDTRLDAFDKITIKNKYTTDEAYVTNIEYSFSGAFNGDYDSKAI